jgi:Response regulator containing a CheY-like receiver domain and a GGDEF domain
MTVSKVLVVDDSRTIRLILKRILTEIGFAVCEAGNGREAIEVVNAEAGSIEIVMADWNMPEMNGFELLTELRRRQELASLRVIMVTTEAELGHMSKALEAGANEYIMKPFTKEIVLEKLELLGSLPQIGV